MKKQIITRPSQVCPKEEIGANKPRINSGKSNPVLIINKPMASVIVTGTSASIHATTISGITVSSLNIECLEAKLKIHAVKTDVTTAVSIPPVPILSMMKFIVPASPSMTGSVMIKKRARLVSIAEIFNFSFPLFSSTFIGTRIARNMAIKPKEYVFSMEISGIQLITSKLRNTPTIEDTEPIIIIGRILMMDCCIADI